MTHKPRRARVVRTTSETDITLALALDEPSSPEITTGLPFFDHMLTAFATHARLSLELRCVGDIEVDDHHTIEDCGLALGQAFDEALADRVGIERFGEALIPMDEALCRVAIDLSGRPASSISLGLRRERIGTVSCENLSHFFQSFAVSLRAAVHVDVLRGDNAHHRAEAAFKAAAVGMRRAIARTGIPGVPSTKGVL